MSATSGKIEVHIGQDYACLLGAEDTTDSAMAMVRDSDDVRRLAACWNACADLTTEQIEDDVVVKLRADRDQCVSACESFKQALQNTIAQRDQLLAALEFACGKLEDAIKAGCTAGSFSRALKDGRAAIAKSTQP